MEKRMNCHRISILFIWVVGVVSAGLLYPNYEGSNPAANSNLNYGNDYYRSVYQVSFGSWDELVEHCKWTLDDVLDGFWVVAVLRKHDFHGFSEEQVSWLVSGLLGFDSSCRSRHLRLRPISQLDSDYNLLHQLSGVRAAGNR